MFREKYISEVARMDLIVIVVINSFISSFT